MLRSSACITGHFAPNGAKHPHYILLAWLTYVAKYNDYVILNYMDNDTATVVERIQRAAARIIATHPAGHQLCLIGGYRYRLLNASARASIDIDYHWEGDLQRKQMEIVDLLRSKLLPEVKRELGYDGDIRPAAGPEAESPAVRIVEMAFYRVQDPGSRIEIPIEITSVARHDAPMVKTIAGTVFLTVSDGDMIESKILACLNRPFFQVRDILDIFLFQDTLPPDAPVRLSKKLKQACAATCSGHREARQAGKESDRPRPSDRPTAGRAG